MKIVLTTSTRGDKFNNECKQAILKNDSDVGFPSFHLFRSKSDLREFVELINQQSISSRKSIDEILEMLPYGEFTRV